ncbi:MAG: hypothetical protein LBP74_08115 [Treponema sp.]|nr:hypothetical protein [Treponema sp.]
MSMGLMPASAVPSIGYAMTGARSGRISLPVSPQAYIYSHFRHVSGAPAPEGTQGVTITKLKILDTLIEQLSKMKTRPEPSFMQDSGNSEERINALIVQYENQIRQVRASGAAMPYSPSAAAAPQGVIFNFSA